ncbi:alpha-1,2-fucosyltransferase [Helicobacter sp. MIT 05-5293]|uniref:alpha-1,2-fucosyltransferase n=1 Tax=Helicobacter sp. MIT 05-5293 TaxID=1548149 RepID=UPI0010FEFBE5|nr:alpha-1,2-fucosyltransferase [Helicobacter sp. MIT 05-5293]TLD82033.1 alpha-1,2-fucosyltransferase [Helicobacter sp. MIT 05-5293]
MNNYKIVQLTCGLGNQMFQYAFAKSLSKHLDSTILLDKAWFKDYPDKYALEIFNLDLEFATPSQIQKATKRQTRLPRFLRKLLKKEKYAITTSGAFEFHEAYLKPNSWKYFIGFFQHPKYLEGIEAEIKQIFTPPPHIPMMILSRKD